MNDPGEVEDMIEIENIKQEPQIKQEINLSCNEELDYLSAEDSTNNNLEINGLETITTQEVPLSFENDSQNKSEFILTKNPFCDIQIANISYNRNAEVCELNNLEVEQPIPENPIDKILFECEKCNRPSKYLRDHNYAKLPNRLKEAIEKEEMKQDGYQTYSCKFCEYVRINPQKYLIHMQRHESEICYCRSCHESFTVSDLLKVHMLIKFRTCEFCRKVFTQEKGYRQHLKIHFPVPKKKVNTKQNLSSEVQIGRFEEITIQEENHEIDPEMESAVKNKEILSIIREGKENDGEESDTYVEDGESREEAEDIESDTGKPESYQKSFSEYVKNWDNSENQNVIPKNRKLKRNNKTRIKESPSKKKRKEIPTPISSTEEIQENSTITTPRRLTRPENLQHPFSVEKFIPRNTIKKEVFLFECARCARNFVSRRAILEHLTRKHSDEFRLWETLYTKKKLEDKESNAKKFNNASMNSDHSKIHHVCSNCDKTFSSKNLLKIHKCELICRLCDKPFVFRNNYIEHLKTHENDCEICKKQFTSESFLTVHRKSAHPEGICYVCHRWFSSEALLKEHKTIVHNLSVMNFFCLICEKSIHAEHKFRAHMESHGIKRPFPCPHCGRSYARYLAMAAHSERCQEFDETNIFECDICKKAFYNKEKFIPHMKQHIKTNEMLEDAKVKDEKVQKPVSNMQISIPLFKDILSSKLKDSKNAETNKVLPTLSSKNKDLKSLHFGPKVSKPLLQDILSSKLKDSKNAETNKVLPTPSLKNKNLKSLHFGPKIAWRESSIQKSLTNNHLKEKRERQEERKQVRNVNDRSLLRAKSSDHFSGMRFELMKRVETMEVKQSENNIYLVTKERPAGGSCEEQSMEKLLILRPITRLTRKGNFESVNGNVKLDVSFEAKSQKDHSAFNLMPVKSEIDPLNLEDPVIDSISDDESDPLALENSSLENDESDPLALENPPLNYRADLEIITESESQDFETKDLATKDTETIDSEIEDSETKDSEIEESEESSMSINEHVLKFRYFGRKESNVVIIEEDKSKIDLLQKKDDSKNSREVKRIIGSSYFFCTICKRRILLRLKVKHMKIHDEGLTMFECSVCEKKFNDRASRRRHEFTHMKQLSNS